jgi:hypothetical protein
MQRKKYAECLNNNKMKQIFIKFTISTLGVFTVAFGIVFTLLMVIL